jgi:hypothetical protein
MAKACTARELKPVSTSAQEAPPFKDLDIPS